MTLSAPSSTPWCRTWAMLVAAATRLAEGIVGSASPVIATGEALGPPSGHDAAGRSSDPTRSHTSVRMAPVPSARIRAILGSTSSTE